MSHVMIVGGTKGIGATCAQTFIAQGCSVTALGRAHRAEDWLSKEINSKGKLTHLVFCQRYRDNGDSWQGEINTSLTLTKLLIELCTDHFDGDPANSIVIMSSIIAHSVASEQPVSYHMSKAALEGMVRYYAVNLGKRGIRVNGVSPCVTLKPENQSYYAEHPEKVRLFNRINPLGRMGTAQDVANVVEFLCSPLAGYVNGEIITVDGGVSLVNQEALARSFLKEPAQ